MVKMERRPIIVLGDDRAFLRNFPQNKKPDGKCTYDFTYFERFIVAHYQTQSGIVYVALDKERGQFSRVGTARSVYAPEQFGRMLPNVRNAVKYTGLCFPANHLRSILV